MRAKIHIAKLERASYILVNRLAGRPVLFPSTGTQANMGLLAAPAALISAQVADEGTASIRSETKSTMQSASAPTACDLDCPCAATLARDHGHVLSIDNGV